MTQKKSNSALARIFAAVITASSAVAQTSSTPSKTAAKEQDDVISLEAFEVEMTQDKGYNVTNAGNALKTGEDLMRIPQSVSIVTRDMINDIGSFNTSDILNYSGIGNFYQGDSATIRGLVAGMMTDGSADTNFDNISLDSITIVRGPIGVLYGFQGTLGGAIIKNTKTPLSKPFTQLSVKADQWGYIRGELDHSRPLGTIGNTRVSYRISATHQDGKTFQDRMYANRDLIFGVLEFKNADSVLRFNGQWQDIRQYPHKSNFLTPEGKPYVGAGRNESFQPKQIQHSYYHIFRAQYLQRIFDNWGLTVKGMVGSQQVDPIGVTLGIGTINYQNGTIGITARRNNFARDDYGTSIDVKGDYKIFGFRNQTMVGALFTGLTSFGHFQTDTAMGARNGQTGATFTVPMSNPNVASWNVLRAEDYVLATLPAGTTTVTASSPNQGATTYRYTWTEYIQQNIDIIPNRLVVVGSIANSNSTQRVELNVVPDAQVPNRVTSHVTQRGNPHRVGVVLNVTKDIALYALNSQFFELQLSRLIDGNFTPPRTGDGKEVGVKTNLFGGRLSTTLGFFDNKYINAAVSAGPGVLSPITGQPYVILMDGTETKGWDLAIFARPMPNWQVKVDIVNNKVRTPTGNPNGNGRLAHTFERWYTLSTRYNFQSDALKKFSIGGGAWRAEGRISTSGTFIYPNGQNFEPGLRASDGGKSVADGGQARMFIEFRPTKHWMLHFDVDNLMDELTMVGAQGGGVVDVSPPRTFSLTARYTF